MKKMIVKIRTSLKFFIWVCIATFLIIGIEAIAYKPIYKVTFDGEQIGYCKQKSILQSKIEKYIENGDGSNNNIAYVQIDSMPEYSLCLLKRGIITNDEEIYKKIVETGVTYYKYYSILEDNEEKFYVEDFTTAESVVQELKEKDSSNIDNIQILEIYETDLKDFAKIEDIVAGLYQKKEFVVANNKVESKKTKSFSTKSSISKSSVALGVYMIKPITGNITSRFGSVSRRRSGAHTGLDISAPSGTSINAAASGTVIWSGYKGSYGNLVVISHSNQVQTYYGHCSKLYVKAGDSVAQGQTIAAVGSTGNSTGPHLHFEIRVNGVAYNPQSYVY